MSLFGQRPCPECGRIILQAAVLGGDGLRLKLDAQAVPGGDYTIWPIGYDPHNLKILCARRPQRVAVPEDLPREQKMKWDGVAESERRLWFMEHEHGSTPEQILERRRMAAE